MRWEQCRSGDAAASPEKILPIGNKESRGAVKYMLEGKQVAGTRFSQACLERRRKRSRLQVLARSAQSAAQCELMC
jgi:hypothetical protein